MEILWDLEQKGVLAVEKKIKSIDEEKEKYEFLFSILASSTYGDEVENFTFFSE